LKLNDDGEDPVDEGRWRPSELGLPWRCWPASAWTGGGLGDALPAARTEAQRGPVKARRFGQELVGMIEETGRNSGAHGDFGQRERRNVPPPCPANGEWTPADTVADRRDPRKENQEFF
jgi:hypothetical protein